MKQIAVVEPNSDTLVYLPAASGAGLARDRSAAGRGFREDLRDFLWLRLDGINPYRLSGEYRLRQEEAVRLQDRLLALLSAEGRELLRRYEEALGAAHYLETGIMAERAFLDGVRILLAAMGESRES